MPTMPASLFWSRNNAPGAEHALVDAHDGLQARGTILAASPVPYTCEYELHTDPSWATAHFEVNAEGAGWARGLKLELAAGRWRATTSERGDLDRVLVTAGHARAGFPGIEDPDLLYGVFDVDLSGSPLTNTLPIRRLDLLRADPGVAHRLSVAWVLLPSLEVVQADQIYTRLPDGKIRYVSETFSADLTIDGDGFVVDYPGLATRAGATA